MACVQGRMNSTLRPSHLVHCQTPAEYVSGWTPRRVRTLHREAEDRRAWPSPDPIHNVAAGRDGRLVVGRDAVGSQPG